MGFSFKFIYMKQVEEQANRRVLLNYPWYVGRVDGGLYEAGKSGMCYPFGGTLNEVKSFINNAPNGTRRFFTWLPAEFVEDDLYGVVNYPA